MKIITCFFIGLLSLFLNLTPLTSAPATNPSQEELQPIHALIKVMNTLHQTHGQSVWPGYDLTETPVIIHLPNGHIYAFHLNSKNPAWKTLNINGQKVLFATEDPWNIRELHLQPSFPIEGQDAFVFKFDERKHEGGMPLLVLIHEKFHLYQFDHFPPEGQQLQGYFDHWNGDNLALMRLEDNILMDYLMATDSLKKTQLLKQFLAVHKERKQFLQPESLFWEKHQQKMEGLADYVSAKAADVIPVFRGFKGSEYLFHKMKGSTMNPNISDEAMKWRHYAVGAALGYALDYLAVNNWKDQIERQGRGLEDILADKIKLSANEEKTLIAEAKSKYNFGEISSQIHKTLNERKAEISSLMNEYGNSVGVTMAIQQPPGVGVSGGGRHKKMVHLADGSTLSVKDTSINRTSDNMWQLNFNNVPYLMQGPEGREFKVEPTTEIQIDNKRLKIADIVRNAGQYRFTSLKCIGKFGEFTSQKHAGILGVRQGKLFIEYR